MIRNYFLTIIGYPLKVYPGSLITELSKRQGPKREEKKSRTEGRRKQRGRASSTRKPKP